VKHAAQRRGNGVSGAGWPQESLQLGHSLSHRRRERERERERERRENMAFAWRRLSFQILSIPKVFTCIPQTNMARDSWCYVNSSIAKVKTQ